jgi:Tfp pilus assembly protein PilF
MHPYNQIQTKISPLKLLAFIVIGLIFIILILEAGLRINEKISSLQQQYKRHSYLKKQGVIRIICLGESTTAKQYSQFLENILNQNNLGLKFNVIDKGIVRANTSFILFNLENNIKRYTPDIVITMIGINDIKINATDESTAYSKILPFLKSSKVYSLMQAFWSRIILQAEIMQSKEKRQLLGKPLTNFPIIGMREINTDEVSPISAKEPPKDTLSISPKNDKDYAELAYSVMGQDNASQAERLFKKAIELNPENNAELGWFFIEHDNTSQAEELFKKAIELNPKNDRTYTELGWFYFKQNNNSQAEELFKKAMELNPENSWAIRGLAWSFLEQNNASQAEELFKKVIEINPKNDKAYAELAWFYFKQNNNSQAEELFKKAIELNPKNQRLYRALSVLYLEMAKPELAEEYKEKTAESNSRYYSLITINNYRKIKDVLDKNGIKLVCVQYPMRDLKPLKGIFQGSQKNIIFVDNQAGFRKAVTKSSYREYFKDMSEGDFGHCTAKGNKLLAENIAKAILKALSEK